MPHVKLYKNEKVYEKDVDKNANLVVLAAIKVFPEIKYGCGIGKCTKCCSKIMKGAEHLPAPNWKEEKMLGEKLKEGYRLICQLPITEDIELMQE